MIRNRKLKGFTHFLRQEAWPSLNIYFGLGVRGKRGALMKDCSVRSRVRWSRVQVVS